MVSPISHLETLLAIFEQFDKDLLTKDLGKVAGCC